MKLNYNITSESINLETLKLLFTDELAFVKKHVLLFLEKHPEVIFAIDKNHLTIGQVMSIREFMRITEEQEKAAREQEKAAKLDPASLTGSHRHY
jgi:hypothetical protein